MNAREARNANRGLAPISERGRVTYAAVGVVLYAVGIYVLVPHGALANPITAPSPAPTFPPIASAEAYVPPLHRDVFIPPPLISNLSENGASPAPRPTACVLRVLGTVTAGPRATVASPRSAAQVSENGGPTRRVEVGDTACGSVVTAIAIGGVTIGSTFVPVSTANDDGLRTQLDTDDASPSPSPEPSAAPPAERSSPPPRIVPIFPPPTNPTNPAPGGTS